MIRSLLESAWTQFQTNQFASGGLVLMAIGAVLAVFRSVPARLWSLVRNRFMAKLEVTSDTTAYLWLQHWLASQPYTHRTRNVQLLQDPLRGHRSARQMAFDNEEPQSEYRLTPGEGTHLFWWKGRPVWLTSSREKNESGATTKAYLFTLTLTSYGMSRAALEELIEAARTEHRKNTKRRAGIWTCRWEDEWDERRGVELRPLASLVYDEHTVDAVVGDAKRFLAQEERYFRLGVPFRRGYLLYGPPGTGKTSLAIALAHEIQRELCLLPLSRPGLDDQMLSTLMTSLPSNALVLIEDVDTIFEGRENRSGNHVTFSGFLNALDGALSSYGVMVVMTTNHRETLDPALLRPGRIDAQVEIGYATWDQARALFLRFFPEAPEALAEAFADRFDVDAGITMAQLQDVLIRNMNDPEAAVRDTAAPNLEAA